MLRLRRRDAVLEGPLEELQTQIEQLRGGRPRLKNERDLLRLRHAAGIQMIDGAPSDPSFAEPTAQQLPVGDPLPEFGGQDLTPGLLRAGILRDGCVLVRGLIPRDAALALADGIDRAYETRLRVQAGTQDAGEYYEEFVPDDRYGEIDGRGWVQKGGGLLAADSPRLHYEMMEQLLDCGMRELVGGYLGEPALISIHKTTLRKAHPSVPGAWHQDGKFMGPVRSLNLWLSLSRCGDEAPGLDLVPRRLDDYVAVGTDDAMLSYQISGRKAEEAAGDTPIIRPIFEPGDALFFDELFLHQTGSDPAMPKPRYAIENWFFGGSAFPGDYAPIAV